MAWTPGAYCWFKWRSWKQVNLTLDYDSQEVGREKKIYHKVESWSIQIHLNSIKIHSIPLKNPFNIH